MDLEAQIKRIRRFLRDPDANIWDDDTLINLYNDVQEDLQNKTLILEDLRAIPVPQTYQFAYMHDWEWQYLPSTVTRFYQCFNHNQQSDLISIHDWEQQQLWSIDPDVSDVGAHFSQPWESFFTTPGEEVKMKFPEDFRQLKHISWNREPLEFKQKSEIMWMDPSYKQYTGNPVCYYRPDELDNEFVLYPRPEESNWIDGDGMSLFEDGDTVSDEEGTILRRYESTLSQTEGIAVDIVDADHNVILFYTQNTRDLEVVTDVSSLPIYLRKYVEYGVISRAYGANTDGRIASLSDFWMKKYELGIEVIKRYKFHRHKDRNYKLKTKGTMLSTRKKHPRLPSTYPHVDPI